MFLLHRILHDRKKLLKGMTKEEIDRLQPILSLADKDSKQLIWDVYHTWCLKEMGVSVIENANIVPDECIPDIKDKSEFAKYISDLIKRYI